MRMQAGFQTAIRLVYPPRCLACGDLVESDFGLCGICWREAPFIGDNICDSCGIPLPGGLSEAPIFCDTCLGAPRPWSQGRAALLYEGTARKLILNLKHGDRTDIATAAASWMAMKLGPIVKPNAVVVPVPLHWQRFLMRRYNQAALLAEALSKDIGAAYFPDALRRTKRTSPLEGVSRAERFERLSGAFEVNPKYAREISGRPIVLVDDVFTSGASFTAATEALCAASPASVQVLALARVAMTP